MSPQRRRRRPGRAGRRGNLFSQELNTEAVASAAIIGIPALVLTALFLKVGLGGGTNWDRPLEALATGGTTLGIVLGSIGLLILIIWWKTR